MRSNEGGLWDDVVPWVDQDRCRNCVDCAPLAVCLAGGIRRDDPHVPPYADEDRCFGCYSCITACPYGAIMMPRAARS